MTLSCRDLFDQVWSVMKIRRDNDITDHIGVVHVKIDIELSWPI